jgi:tetratricopeptide (TPR) repeat protein
MMQTTAFKVINSRILAGFDPLGWIHQASWYKKMLRADWFESILPYWNRFHLDYIVSIVFLLLVYLFVRKSIRRIRHKREIKALSGVPVKKAKTLEELGQYRLAAEAYTQLNRPKKAYELFLKSESWSEAAEIAKKLGMIDDVVELYLRINNPKAAALVLREANDLARAEELYRLSNDVLEVAMMYQEAGEHLKAAEAFEEEKFWSKAAMRYSMAEEYVRAAECLLNLTNSTVQSLTGSERKQLQEAIKTFDKLERYGDSARLYRLMEEYEEASRGFLKAEEFEQAAACLVEANDFRKAAKVYQEIGQKDNWLRMLEKMKDFGELDDQKELLKAYLANGMYLEAVPIYLEKGDRKAAALAYIAADLPAEAAEIYRDLGKNKKAAELFLEAGEPEAARDLFIVEGDIVRATDAALVAGMDFEAGKGFFTLGEFNKAIDALQRVEKDSIEYREASSLLGQCFSQVGDVALAKKMHFRATQDLDLERDNMELFYQLACFLEKSSNSKELKGARHIFREILAINYNYKDVSKRIK